jgi:hypothetical protein
MKKLIVFAAALLVSATAFAEGFGIVGGYTSSSMKMQEMTFKSSAGVHAGFAYNVPLGIGFSLQPELIYNVKGYNWQGDKDAAALQEKAKFGYVEVPVQLQWGPDLLLLRPYVLAEPFVGFAVTGKKILTAGETKVNWDNFKSRLEDGGGVGAGIEIYNRVQVSFKYYWNFEDAKQWSDITDKVKGKGFSGLLFTAGIFF